MAKFRRKPIVVDAFQWNGEMVDSFERISTGRDSLGLVRYNLIISTREGDMYAIEGDWIITEDSGEIYICRDYLFRDIYEAVNDD